MKAEFTAIIRPAPEGGYWAICPEVPGANGQGETVEEAKESLKEAIELILEDLRENALNNYPAENVIQDTIVIG
ncbi:type II toxin-antitoxin system HicB family antitoxin [Hippea alviniae]|uniref:type II toxin-antitoxin system HicB family antitoxin n=1 Tax=Hippea alviniae TaxID=1279027 RepID=UPI0003B455F3|nr:type II toxin-antitoxin system HicB family antitoxin [Hippea alviniae]